MQRIWLLCLLISFATGASADEDDNIIIVTGRRREATQTRKTGQSVTVQPTDSSRYDSITHLKRESAVVAPETGRISPSGFVVPRIRGQDTSLTDVYVDDVLLQDPYSGLPIVEDLDLRAFGGLEIHQGVPPPDIPGLNPIGTLRYHFLDLQRSYAKAGLQTGRPFGWSSWMLGQYHADREDSSTTARVYGRHHQTDGRYAYYSDEGTPYNTNDDTIKVRDNNDQRSMQAVPYVEQTYGPYRFQGLGWIYRAHRGLASSSMIVPSAARATGNGHVINALVARNFALFEGRKHLQFSVNGTDLYDQRLVDDGDRRFLGNASNANMQVHTHRGSLNLRTDEEFMGLFAGFESSTTEITNSLDTRQTNHLLRQATLISIGTKLSPLPAITMEAKLVRRQHSDQTSDVHSDQTIKQSADAVGTSIGFYQNDWGAYVQFARVERLPSLLEEFGDGGSARPNDALNAEVTRHREMGTYWRHKNMPLRLGLAAYEDKTNDKIVFVPVMANAVKALNLQETSIRGVDVRGEWTYVDTSLYLSVSRLLPYDETRSDHKVLPGVAERVFVAEIEHRSGPATLRWLARYRSAIYRDLTNTIELPGAWIHDASADFKQRLSGYELQLGLNVRNVFNTMAVPVTAAQTSDNTGRTAYSDIAGAPLPGRQWVLSLALAM